MTSRDRIYGGIVSALTLLAVASPLIDDEDGFPLSTFPMFSKARPEELTLAHVVLVDGDRREPIAPGLVFSSEVLQTKVAIARAVRGGPKAALELCQKVAARLRAGGRARGAVEVRTDRFHVLTYVDGDETPMKTHLHARCDVAGTSP